MPQDQPKTELSLDEFREQARKRYEIPQGLWESVRGQESGGNINAVSKTGVRGEFQVTKRTAAGYGMDRDDPFHQIASAAKNLREGYDKYKDQFSDDNERWLAATSYYYYGPGGVRSDGSLSTDSKDGVSNPAEHVTKIAKRWKQYNDSQGTTPPPQAETAAAPGVAQGRQPSASQAKIVTPETLSLKQSRPLTARERRVATDETARIKATPQIARMVEDFEALKREGSVDAARSVAAKIKQQYGKWMEVGDGTGGWPYVKSKVRGWNPVQPAAGPSTPFLEDRLRAEYESKSPLGQVTERASEALARGGGQVSRMLRQTTGAGLGLARGLAGGDFRPVDLPEWRQAEEARMRVLEERRRARPSSFVTDAAEGVIEAVPAAAGAIGATMLTGGGLPAAMAIGGGMGAAGADWRDPKRALAQTGIGAVAPVVGGVAGSRIGGAVARRLANPVGQAAARVGGELAGGGAGNVLGSGAEQLAFEGRIDPRELAKQAVIGAALNAPGAARMAGTSFPVRPAGARPTAPPQVDAQQANELTIRTAIADYTRRVAEISRAPIDPIEKAALTDQARQEYLAARRGVNQPATEPKIATPEAPAVQPTSQLPPGVQIVRVDRGEQIPPRQRGQRQFPMEFDFGDGTSENVLVIADGRVNETTLRPMIEQALRTPTKPAAQPPSAAQPEAATFQPPPVQPVAPGRQAAPIQFIQLGPEGLRTARTPGGAVITPESPLPSQKLLMPGTPEPPRPPARQPGARVGTPRPPGASVYPRNQRGAIVAPESSLPSRKLLTAGNQDNVPTAELTDALTTQRLPEPVYPDAPLTQEMPEIRQRIAAENAPTTEMPTVPAQRRTAAVARQPQPGAVMAESAAAPIQRRTAAIPRQPGPELTNRTGQVGGYEGAELPRRAARRIEGQLVEIRRQRPAAPARPGGGRLPRPLEGRMYRDFPADRRAMVGEGRRVEGEIEAGRGDRGQFGKIAEGMFKSPEGGQKGFDSFFNDSDVKGAVGLSRDASMGDVRIEMKKQLARMMGVKADEVSLTQISPETWNRWANQKRLSPAARAKMQTAIERYQKGVIDDIEKAVEVKAEKPQQPVEAVQNTAAEPGRKINHSKFGEVTEAADQSRVRKGYMRVIGVDGKAHIIKNPRTKGGGNREAAFVKQEVSTGAIPAEAMSELQVKNAPKSPLEGSPTRTGPRTNYAIPAEAMQELRGKEEKRPGTIMGSGFGALQGLFERKAPKANPNKADIESASLGQSVGKVLQRGGNELRALWTSMDFSAPLSQGALLSIAHPIKAVRSGGKMFRSLSRTQSDAIDAEIAFHPLRKMGEKAGLFLATSGKLKGDAAGLEEAYRGTTVQKIPGISHTERAYRTFLDSLRLSVWESYTKSLQASGKTFESDPKAYKDAAAFINIATGRGQLKKGGALEKASDLMGSVLFAPRNMVANFQVIDPARYISLAPGARKLVLKDALTAFGAMIGTAALLRQAGFNVGFNPENDDFMVARSGNTRYDLTFGKKTQVQFLARMAMGMYRKTTGEGNLPGKDPLSVAQKFGEGKLAPAISTAKTFITGKDFKGEAIADKSKAQIAWETAAPMLWRDMAEAYEQEGMKGVIKSSPAVFGARVNTFADRPKSAFLDVPPEVRSEQKRFGMTRPFLTPRRDETLDQFTRRKTLANEWNVKYGKELASSEVYKSADPEIRKAALEYLKNQIVKQTGTKRPSLYLLNAGHILTTVRESAREKQRNQ